MRSICRSIVLCALIVAASPSAARAAAPIDMAGCVVPAFGSDEQAAVAACTAVLSRPGLSDVDRARILAIRGRASQRAHDGDAAIRDYDAAIKLAPQDPEIRIRRGWMAYDRRDYQLATALAAQARELDANNADSYDLLGAVASMIGNLGMAKASYDKAIEMQPDDILPRFHRFQLYKRVGAQREAVEELDNLLKLKTTDLDTMKGDVRGREMSYRTMSRLERAAMLQSMGRYPEAEKAYNDFVAVEPGLVSYGWRAWYRFDRSQFELAQADLDKAMAYDDKFYLLHSLQGQVYLYTKQYERAVPAFTRALELLPDSGALLWSRSLALRELQRNDEAIKDALKAVSIDRDFLGRKMKRFADLGYLQPGANEKDMRAAVRDAVQACMLDKRCW
jgi:tetratricopeptide (TPR) repeat protein